MALEAISSPQFTPSLVSVFRLSGGEGSPSIHYHHMSTAAALVVGTTAAQG